MNLEELMASTPPMQQHALIKGFQAGAASRDAEIAELVEDKGRLDFLDGNSRFKMGWSVGQSPVGNLSISAVIQPGKEPTTIREAIDTALAKVRKP